MDVNFVRITFILFGFSTGFVGLLINIAERYLPAFLTRSYRYGKFSAKVDNELVAKTEVPKRWFKHFYIFAAPLSAYVLYTICNKCFYNGTVSDFLYWVLDLLHGESRKPLVSLESAFLAHLIFTIHIWKRLYESVCVSVFSNKKMNISHYIIGFVHYLFCLSCIISETEGFVRGSEGSFSLKRLTLIQLAAAAVLLWASFSQLKANRVLSNLRRNKDGVVVTEGYKIPHGGLFDYISGALQLTEILVYASMSVILWDSITYHYVSVWVLINQMECALLTHWWYRKTFKNYPKERKVLVPYLF